MFEVRVIDTQKKIAYLKWAGNVKPSEVGEATEKLQKIFEEFERKKYYLAIDTVELKVFAPETKVLIIEQQKIVVPLLLEVADVIPKALTKNQLEETKKEAGNQITKGFGSVEEAINYLKMVSVY